MWPRLLEGAAATVGAQSFALGQSRALAASLGRLAAGSFVERRRRAGDLLEVGDRGWQQAVVRSAALDVQGGSDVPAISSRALGP